MKKDWKVKKLGEVCEFQGGSQPPKEEWIKEPREGYIRMLQIRDFTQSRNFDIEYVKETNKLRLCNSDDILLGRYGASVGKVLTGLSGAYNVAILKTIPSSDFYKPFIKYYFQSPFFQNPLLTLCNQRAAQAGFNREDIYDFPIPYLTLEEQKRIVAVLDKKFAQIETLKTAAEKNLQNTKQLFQAELEKAFSNSDFGRCLLGDIITVLTDFNANGGYAKLDSNVKMYDEPNYAVMVRTTDLERNDFNHGVKYVDKNAYDMLSKSTLFGNEIIMNKIGSAGKIYLMPCLNRPATLARNAFLIRLKETVDVRFIFLYLSSPEGTAAIMKHVHGAVTKTITKEEVRSIIVPLPSLEEQKRIVAHLDYLSEKVHQLEGIYTKQLADCDELKQSLLQKAFEGEL